MKKYLLPIFSVFSLFILPGLASGQTITTIAGNGTLGYNGDGGPAIIARFEYAWFPAIDYSGNLYFTDNFNSRIRKVNLHDTITTFAGTGAPGFAGDGGPAAAAQFIGAAGIAIDQEGDVYFADINNSRLRKVNAAGIISTITGTGSAGFSGDGGPASAAQLNAPCGVALDKYGNIYFADQLNFRIRRIDLLTGMITTVAGTGTGGYTGDGGPATLAQISPTGIALDRAGNIYLATNNRIRKVDTGGNITTIAGNGSTGFGGDGLPATAATLNQPFGVSADWLGNIYIADQYNDRIRKINRAGIIKTIAGTGTAGYGGDGGPATAALLNLPRGLCTDGYANVYICDWNNFRIREILSGNHLPIFVNAPADSMTVCENSSANPASALLRVTDLDTVQTETWTLFRAAKHGMATVAFAAVSHGGDTLSPSGITYTPLTGYTGNDTFTVQVDDGQSLDTISIYVRVKPLPDTGLITGNTNICIGVADTLSDTVTGGRWSTTNTTASVSADGIVTGLRPGTDTIVVSFSVAGCTDSTSVAVIVYPSSAAISGPAAVCTGESITLDGNPAGGIWSITNTLATISGGIVTGDTAGIDTVIYTIANYCGIFSTIKPETIIGFTIPSVVINAYPDSIIAGETDTLIAHVTNAGGISYGYQWQNGGHNIPGATDSTYMSSGLANHDSLTCFIHNGPCNFSTFGWIYVTYYNPFVGVRAVNAPDVLRLAPNPNNGSFTLYGITSADITEASIDISDAIGRVVYHQVAAVSNGVITRQIDAGAIPGGIYILEMTTLNGRSVVRFVMDK